MNFQAIEQAGGNNVTMCGIITDFVGEGVNPNSGKPYKKVKIKDDSGVAHKVTLRGTLPTVEIHNQRAQFSLSTYQGNYEGQPYTGYSGFWNSTAQVAPETVGGYPKLPQQAPQQAQQGPSRQPESPKGPTGYDKTQEQILRQCAGKCASWLVAAGKIGFDVRFEEAENWKYYFETGQNPDNIPEPDQSVQEPVEETPFD